MSTSISNQNKAYMTEDKAAQSMLDQRRIQQGEKLEDLEQDHKKELESLQKQHETQRKDLAKAYDVELSQESKSHAKDLDEARKSMEKELEITKVSYNKEFEKIAEREHQRVDTYKKNQDLVIEKLHDKYQAAQEDQRRNQN
ncbi:MAG: hypothetical protein H7222_11140 [Methylotenera sp.]|nr:hypothetical protein [Oligoflexia bacterium]